MAGTAEVLSGIDRVPGVRYPVLVPNKKGLDAFLEHLSSNPLPPGSTGAISVFTGATDAFTLANTHTTVSGSLSLLAPVIAAAISHGLKVRGYVSVVIACPYEGAVRPERVRDVVRELVGMGCGEVSLGDTVGVGTPVSVGRLVECVGRWVPVEKLAVSVNSG
jgi:hydroxymethylglutaryl-CoA lyase